MPRPGVDLASEAPLSAVDRFAGALPVALLPSPLLRPGAERVGWSR